MLALGATLALLMLTTVTANAGDLYWRPGSSCADTNNASGIWNNSITNWCVDNFSTKKAWVPGSNAIFDGTNPIAITASGSLSVSSIEFTSTGWQISGGTFTDGTATENVIKVTSGTATISSVLAGSKNYVKTGAGGLTLSANNTFTGTLTVNDGTLFSGGALGDPNYGTVVLSGATLVGSDPGEPLNLTGGTLASLSTGGSWGGPVTLVAATTSTIRVDNTDVFYLSGGVKGSGDWIKTGTGTLITDAINAATGALTINGGKFVKQDSGSLNNVSGITVNTGTVFEFFANGSGGSFDRVISGAGGLEKSRSGTIKLKAASTYSGPTTVTSGTLSLGGDGVAGSIANTSGVSLSASGALKFDSPGSSAFNAVISGPGMLAQSNGTVNLGGTQTFTGAVNVDAGTLLVNGSLASSSSAVTVASGATLGGGGTINRPVTLVGASVLEPGSSVGTVGVLQTGDLSATGAAALNFQLGAAGTSGGSLNDLVSVTGSISFGSGTAIVNVSQSTGGSLTAGTYRLFNYTGSLSGTLPTTVNMPTGWVGQVVNNVAGQVSLVVVPDTLYWAPGGGSCTSLGGSSGLWDASTNNWCTSNDASGTKIPWPTPVGVNAVFRGTAGTVTVTGFSPNVRSLSFEASGVTTIQGGTLTGTANTAVTLNATSGATGTISSGLVDNTGLTYNKTGAGTVTLSGANTFIDAMTVSGGTLAAANATALGTAAGGVTVSSGATLDIQNTTITNTEAVTLNGGTLKTSAGTSSLAGPVTLTANSTIDVSGTQLTLSGAIDGVAGINWSKTGAGILKLSGNNNFAGALTVSGGTLAVTNTAALGGTAGSTTVTSGATLDIQGVAVALEPVTLNGGTLQTSTGTSSLSGPVTLAANSTMDVGASATLTLSGVVGGSGTWTKTGTGSLISTATNTATGLLTVSAGKFVFNPTGSISFSAPIAGTGTVEKIGSGSLTLSGTNTHTGPLTVTAGTLVLNTTVGTSATNAVTVASGATLSTPTGTTVVDRPVTLSGGTLAPGSASAVGTVNTGAFTTSGASTLNFQLSTAGTQGGTANDLIDVTGALSFGGTTTVNISHSTGGTLAAGVYPLFKHSGALTGTLTMGTGVPAGLTASFSDSAGVYSLVLAPPVLRWAPSASAANCAAGTGLGNGGTWTTVNAWCNAANTKANWVANYTAEFPDSAGAVDLAGAQTVNALNFTHTSGTYTLQTGSLLGSAASGLAIDVSNANATAVLAIPLSTTGTGVQNLTKSGSGTLTLTNTATFTGAVAVNGGTLKIGNGAATGDLASITGVSVAGGATLAFNRSDGFTFGKSVTGSGGLQQLGGGTLTLNVSNSYTGPTSITSGTLVVADANALGGSGTGTTMGGGILEVLATTLAEPLTLNSGRLKVSTGTVNMSGTIAVNGTSIVEVAGTQLTLSGVISGSADLYKEGAGVLVLGGANPHSGTVYSYGGTLLVNGSMAASGNGSSLTMVSSILGGTGVIGRGVALTGSSKLEPGLVGQPGTLTLGKSDGSSTFTMVTDTALNFQLGTPGVMGGGVNDFVDVKGSIAFDSGATLNVTSTGGSLASGYYPLFRYTGTMTNTPILKLPSGVIGSFVSDTNNKILYLEIGSGNTLRWAPDPAADCVAGTNLGGSQQPWTATGAYWCGSGSTKLAWIPGGTAVFTGNASNVTVVGAHNIGGLTFETSNVSISGGTSLTGAASETLLSSATGVSNVTISTVLAGTQNWAKDGAGTITLSGNNTFSGALALRAGRLVANHANALGSNGGGTTTVSSGATLEVKTTSDFYESTTLAGGTLLLSSGAAQTIGSSIATSTTSTTSTIDVAAGTTPTFSGALSGDGNLIKAGGGNLILTTNSTVAGALTVNGGKFVLGAAGTTGSINSVSSITVDTGAALRINRSDDFVFSKVIIGQGGLEKAGNNNLTLDSNHTYTGVTKVENGTLTLGNVGTSGLLDSSVGGIQLVTSTTTLAFNRTDNFTLNAAITGAGALVKNNLGTVTLGGDSSYTGLTTINAGAIAVTHANALGQPSGGTEVKGGGAGGTLSLEIPVALSEPVTLSGGSALVANTGVSSLENGLLINSGGATNLYVNGTELTVKGSIGVGGYPLYKQGTGRLVLAGSGNIAPALSVQQGTLLVNGTFTSAQTLSVTTGTLGGNGTYAGFASFAGGGTPTLEPGDPGLVGTLKLGNSSSTFTTYNAAQLNFQLGQPNVQGGTYNDWVEITGNLTFNAGTTLNITQSPGGNLVAGRYPLFKFTGTLTGLPQFVNVAGGLVGTVGSSGGVVYVDIGSSNLRWAPFADANCSAGTLGGDSTWDGTAQWCTDGNTKILWPPSSGYTAVFTKDGDVATIASGYSPNVKDLVFQGASIQIKKGTGAGIINSIGTELSVANASHSATISAVLAGATYSKTGAGTVTLSGANTFTGAMTVSGGTLAAANATALGTAAGGVTVSSGATLDIQNTTITNTEAVTLNGGTLKASAGTSSLAGPVTLAANSTMDVASGATLTLSGKVSGGSGVTWTKTGVGNLITTATNDFNGALTVSEGKFVLGNATASGSIDNAASITVNQDAVFGLNRSDVYTFNKVIAGAGGLEKTGAFLALTGANTYTGPTVVQVAALNIGSTGSISNTSGVSLASGTTLQFSRNTDLVFNRPITGAGGVQKFNGTLLTLGGDNSYTGTTYVEAGVLAITHPNALGGTAGGTLINSGTAVLDLQNVTVVGEPVTIAVSGATLKASTGTSSLGGAVTISAAATASAIDVGSGAQLTLSGVISGSGSNTVNKTGAGVLVVSGTGNTHTGAVNVNAGTLLVNGNLASNANAVTVAAGSTLGGSGTINRPVSLSGTVEPGNASGAVGKLTTNALTANANSTLNFQLGAVNQAFGASALNDAVDVAGNLTFNSNITLNITQSPGGSLVAGRYPLFKFTGTVSSTLPQVVNVPGGQIGTVGKTSATNGVVYLDIGAGNLRWAPNSSDCVSNLGGGGPSDFWNATSANWCNDSNTKSIWISDRTAVFPGTGGTVNVVGTQSIGGLDFQTSGVTVSGDTLTGMASTEVALNAASGVTATISSVLADNTDLTYKKTGAGTVVLSGANTFTGAMTVSAGTLGASSNAALGAPGGGSTTVNSGAALDILGAVGAEPITLNTGATLKTSAGTGSLSGAVTLAGNSTMDVASSATLTLSGAVDGSGTWTKTGTGNLITTADNTATGALTVGAGKFVLGNNTPAGNLNSVASITVASGAALRFNRSDSSLTFAKVIDGAGGLEKANTGTLILTGNHTYTGATTVDAGTLQVGNGGTTGSISATSGVSLVVAGSTLQFNRSDDITFDKPVTGAGALTQQGAGKLTLSVSNSYNGLTSVNAGTLAVTHASALGGTGTGTTVAGGATLDLQNVAVGAEPVTLQGTTATLKTSTGTSSLAGPVSLNATTNTIDVGTGAQLTLSGVISGSNTVNKTGAGVLVVSGAANTHTGAVNVNGGTLLVNGSLFTSNNAVTVASGATLGGSGTINRAVNLSTGATLAPGSMTSGVSGTGKLTVNHGSGLMVGTDTVLSFQASVPGMQDGTNDFVDVSAGALNLGGAKLTITHTTGGTLGVGNYPLFKYGTRSGTLPTLQAGTPLAAGTTATVEDDTANKLVYIKVTSLITQVFVSGKVFNDGGAPQNAVNTGTPNDGLLNGNEAGVAGVTVNLTDCAVAVHATAVTDANGAWQMEIPSTKQGTQVCVGPTLSAGYIATGANAAGIVTPNGSPTGIYTYNRAGHRTSFMAPTSGTVVLDFGQVPVSNWTSGSSRTGAPGTPVLYAQHRFTAGTAGDVSFSIGIGTGVSSNDGWSEAMYRDDQCTGTQSGVPVLSPLPLGPVSLVQGQTVCLLVQQSIPGNATIGQSRTVPVKADLSFLGANPSLSASYSLNDVMTVSAGQLDMRKDVRVVGTSDWGTSNQAKSGQELEYRITIMNKGPATIRNVKVVDAASIYTTFKRATVGTLPASLGTCTKTTPASATPVECSVTQTPGGSGAIEWSFSGSLDASTEVELRYVVEVK